MINVNELKFDEKGLIPAVVVDAKSKKVLTVAYMNKESLEISIAEKKTCFFSRLFRGQQLLHLLQKGIFSGSNSLLHHNFCTASRE